MELRGIGHHAKPTVCDMLGVGPPRRTSFLRYINARFEFRCICAYDLNFSKTLPNTKITFILRNLIKKKKRYQNVSVKLLSADTENDIY